jgi:serine phosphatase RsbU (regulator of sigma subunit)
VRNRIRTTPNVECELEISKACHASDDSAGGDRVEALEGPDGRIHLIVLDACGHGSRAEDLADMSLHTVRTLLWQGSTPASAFAWLNSILLGIYAHAPDTSFGSGAIATLDPRGSKATFASAGHVDVIRFRRKGRCHDHLSPTGPLFGVVKEAQYRERTFPYAVGETFLLVTDGLLEMPPADGGSDFWNMAQLCRVTSEVRTSAGALSAAHIVSQARRHFGGKFKDDVAVLVATTKLAKLNGQMKPLPSQNNGENK